MDCVSTDKNNVTNAQRQHTQCPSIDNAGTCCIGFTAANSGVKLELLNCRGCERTVRDIYGHSDQIDSCDGVRNVLQCQRDAHSPAAGATKRSVSELTLQTENKRTRYGRKTVLFLMTWPANNEACYSGSAQSNATAVNRRKAVGREKHELTVLHTA